jgi:hypothetical protein
LPLRRHFVDPQVGRSDPDAHAVSPRALCKKICGGYAADIARMKRVRGDTPVKKAL